MFYTTNAVQSVNAQLRKVTKHRGAFPTPDSVRKVLYLAMMKASERWSRPVVEGIRAQPGGLVDRQVSVTGTVVRHLDQQDQEISVCRLGDDSAALRVITIDALPRGRVPTTGTSSWALPVLGLAALLLVVLVQAR